MGSSVVLVKEDSTSTPVTEKRSKRVRNAVKYSEGVNWDDIDFGSDEDTPPAKKAKPEVVEPANLEVCLQLTPFLMSSTCLGRTRALYRGHQLNVCCRHRLSRAGLLSSVWIWRQRGLSDSMRCL
jgi:hypothetical protein